MVLRYDDGGWVEAIGGHVALDLVNTVSWRPDPARTVDRIDAGPGLVRWAEHVGLLDPGADLTEATPTVVREVQRLRERLHRVVHPLAAGSAPAPEDLAGLHRTLVRALGRAEVRTVMPLDLAFRSRAVADLPDALALHVWWLLEREDARRLRVCAAGDCGWIFLDRTRNGSRRWCSSADCGNRTRVRRHYARRTAGSR